MGLENLTRPADMRCHAVPCREVTHGAESPRLTGGLHSAIACPVRSVSLTPRLMRFE